MKPIYLKLTAFGSYVEFTELDFKKNLRDEKIFLIHGATGSGKTTLLDAICYALYGSSAGGLRKEAMMRSKGVGDDVAMKVEFTFELGDKTYKIYRELKYFPKRKQNQYQQTAELTCDGNFLERQSTNVTNKIKELLGFDVDQFRQVVLLPQGEFKKFLFAGAKERQPVLDALFNAEFYQKIEDAIEGRFVDSQKIFDDLNKQKATLELQLQGASVDEESLKNFAEQISAAQKKSAELKKFFDEATEKYHEAKKLSDDFAELDKRNLALFNAKDNLERATTAFAAAQTEYEKRDAEISTRQELQARVQKLEDAKKLVDLLTAKREALPAAQQAVHSAKKQLDDLNADAKKFAAWLDKYKRQRDELSDADKKLDDAKKLVETLKHIAELERKLSATNLKVSTEQEHLDAARAELERLQKLQLDGSAARLAKNLRDGEPCPVCGSTTHYHVDFGEKNIPTDSDIKAAQANVDNCRKALDAQKKSASSTEGQLISYRDELKKFPEVPSLDDAKKSLAKAADDAKTFSDCKTSIANGEKRIEDNNAKLEQAHREHVDATGNYKAISSAIEQLERQIPEEYSANPKQLDAELVALRKNIRELEAAWNSADKNFRDAGNKKSSCEATFNAAQKAQVELAEKLTGKNRPDDVEDFNIIKLQAQKNHEEAMLTVRDMQHQFDSLKNLAAQINEVDEKISAAQKTFLLWKKLSDAASGKITGKKISFVRYYLRAMFSEVLTEANYRLGKMSGQRYELRQKDAGARSNSVAGLNLEILDEFNGQTRPVETLSGGESFLASLALALGLAAVVRNRAGGIKLDTIFIDEGFGSLDNDTLNFAISTITQHSGGRLVGIISHVEELKNQIPVRLEVTKSKTGSTAEFKHGLSRD
ncbi:MAG: SMC family ATPase [Selenomonadaceae bacterium]|nr:SMC family ATPase [Selenomonadaceae bacterium]